MRMEGRFTFAASRAVVWGLLYDPVILERILPGCEAFEAVATDEYRITLYLRAGPISDRFVGTLRLDRVEPFTGFDFQADGESPNGLVNCRGRAYLETGEEGRTVLCYEANVYAGGRLASVSGRLLETTARAFARRCLEGLERQVDMRTRIYTSSLAAAPPTTLSPTGSTIARLGALRRGAMALLAVFTLAFFLRAVDRRRTQRLARQLATLLEQAPEATGPKSG